MAETKKCPYCAEEIKAEAIKCRFCGERLDIDTQKSSTNSEINNQLPWLFVGAYAFYSGTADVANKGVYEAQTTLRLEVKEIDLENKRWKAATEHVNYRTNFFGKWKKLNEDSDNMWLPIDELVIPSKFSKQEAEYEGQINTGREIRKCIIQKYSNQNNSIHAYWDKEIRWPLRLTWVVRNKVSLIDKIYETRLDILLRETNVPRLKEITFPSEIVKID